MSSKQFYRAEYDRKMLLRMNDSSLKKMPNRAIAHSSKALAENIHRSAGVHPRLTPIACYSQSIDL